MTQLIYYMAAILFMAGLSSCRVMDKTAETKQTRASVNDLLLNADPLENDIFYEPRAQISTPPRDISFLPSPILHLLKTLSKPSYVDTSDFRMPLPPSIDINRQLTLLSASKSFRPPSKVLYEEETPIEYDEASYVFNPSPLFRGDFRSEDIEYYVEDPEEAVQIVSNSDLDDALEKGPIYSTSVSLSSSVSFSNNSSPLKGQETTKSTVTESTLLTSVPTHDISTAPTDSSTPSISIGEESESKPSIKETPRTSKLLQYNHEDDYPEYRALSPLAHILAGFRGELGPFGGDRATDSFVRGFRPIGF